MADPRPASWRRPVLPPLPIRGAGATVRPLPAATRLSLRVKNILLPHADVPSGARPRRTPDVDGASFEAPVHGAAPVRGAPQDEEVERRAATMAGLPLVLPINRCAVSGERTIARLGPDEWLLIGPADDAGLAGEAATALAGRVASLVDVSHRQVAIAVEGERAADVLNAGCPLDLHPASFPAGSATRTLLGKVEIVLLRPGADAAFRVEVGRSFAAYGLDFLEEAVRDL